jgi:hypothetical protein
MLGCDRWGLIDLVHLKVNMVVPVHVDGWDFVSELQPPAFVLQVMYERGEPSWNDIDWKTEERGEKSVPLSLCPPQIRCGMTWGFKVRGRRQIISAMVRPGT